MEAHRTPMRLVDFAKSAKKNNLAVIIAGAGGSAHLPGMTSLSLVPEIANYYGISFNELVKWIINDASINR